TIAVVIVALGPTDAVVRWGYPPLLVYLLVYGWVLLRHPAHALTASRATLLLLDVSWLVAMTARLRSAGNAEDGWDALFPTVFMGVVIFLVIGFLYFSPRRALWHAG